MKSKHWILLIGAVFIISCALSLPFFLSGETAATAEIWSDNQLVRVVDLRTDQTFTVETADGYNVVTVENGKIAVMESNCPDKHCMHRGFCNSGAAIVCLPHRFIIKFVGKTEIDSVIG